MQPILFTLAGVNRNISTNGKMGVPPPMLGRIPIPPTSLLISGVTKDYATAAVIGLCIVTLFRTADDMAMEKVTSDATTGVFSFSSVGLSESYYVVAFTNTGAAAGVTRNDVVGV